jgi:hypothetical protein
MGGRVAVGLGLTAVLGLMSVSLAVVSPPAVAADSGWSGLISVDVTTHSSEPSSSTIRHHVSSVVLDGSVDARQSTADMTYQPFRWSASYYDATRPLICDSTGPKGRSTMQGAGSGYAGLGPYSAMTVDVHPEGTAGTFRVTISGGSPTAEVKVVVTDGCGGTSEGFAPSEAHLPGGLNIGGTSEPIFTAQSTEIHGVFPFNSGDASNGVTTIYSINLTRSNDPDHDGFPTGHDTCPNDFNPKQEATCQPDGDGDGTPDRVDNCPANFNPDQADLDGNGRGDVCQSEPDADKDLVPNSLDHCPGAQPPSDAMGCPLAPDPGGSTTGGSGGSSTTVPQGRLGQLGRTCGTTRATWYEDPAGYAKFVDETKNACVTVVSNDIARRMLAITATTKFDLGEIYGWYLHYGLAVEKQDTVAQDAAWDFLFSKLIEPLPEDQKVFAECVRKVGPDRAKVRDCQRKSALKKAVKDDVLVHLFGQVAVDAAKETMKSLDGAFEFGQLAGLAGVPLDVAYYLTEINDKVSCLEFMTTVDEGKLVIHPRLVQNVAYNRDVPGRGIVFTKVDPGGPHDPVPVNLTCLSNGLVKQAGSSDDVLEGSATAIFSAVVPPTGDVSTPNARAGKTLGIHASGFAPAEQIALSLHSADLRLGLATADSHGEIRMTVAIPLDATNGKHNVVAHGLGVDGKDHTLLLPVRVSGGRSPNSSVLPILLAIGLLLVGGASLGYWRWRRSANSPEPSPAD